jgi:hypothetical protein
LALAALFEDLPADRADLELTLQAITITSDVLLVALSAEPSSGWVEVARDLLPDKVIIPVGLANQVCGYLPTAREASQGHDEVGGLLSGFGLSGSFRPGFAEAITEELAALLAPLGEDPPLAYRDRIAELRRRIDHLWSERDEARALAMRSRSAQIAAERRLGVVIERAENLKEAAGNLRRLLQQATSPVRELEHRV